MAGGHSPALPGERGRSPSKGERAPSACTSPAPSPAEEPSPPPLLPPGAAVEVRVDGPGFHGSWFEATVVHHAPARGRCGADRYTVAYAHPALAAGAGDAAAALAEPVAASHIRPRPPPLPSPPAPGFPRSVTVAFPFTREVITVPRHYVRPRRDYVGGEWVPPRAVIAIQPGREVRVYEAGDKVEAVRDRELYGSSWFPARVVKAIDGLSYIVKYSDEEEGDKAAKYLHWQYIRPAVDRFWTCENGMQIALAPGSVVEAYCDRAWSPGVVRGMSGEGEYEVAIKGKEAEQVVIKVLELLRPRHDWDGSQWSIVGPERQGNVRCHSASGKRPSSPVEVTSSDDEQISRVDSSLSGLRKPLASNHSLNSCLLSGYLTPPDKSVPTVVENPISQDTLPITMLPGNKGVKTNTIEAFKGNNLFSDNVSCQANQDSSMDVITHLIRLPKKTGSKEAYSHHSSLHSAVVIGLLESIMKSCIENSKESFEERNSILSKLKANAEYVQSCMNILTEANSEYAKHLEEKDTVEAQKLEKKTSLSQLNSLRDENDKAIAVLELKRQKIEKEIEHEETELSRLEKD
ncbi:unnamed protein product [Urochloa decumbens]|uniref:Agenet domain-containing protein n=1 Tax=Urochloa decumbens TaxID=240449 RepID=A0ABC9B3I5_9POAL